MSVEQVCAQTKIQARFVEALEAGRWSEIPSNTHLRAFSLALCKACGGDPGRAAALVQRLLAATAPVGSPAPGGRGFDTLPPAPSLMRPAPGPKRSGGAAVLAAVGPALEADETARPSTMASASARLRSLPLTVLLSLLALAGTLSYGAAWAVEHWRQHTVALALDSQATAPVPPDSTGPAPANPAQPPAAARESDADASAPGPSAAPAAGSVAAAQSQAPPAAPGVGLTLRARRPCWLVLSIDGKRLPTITMQDGDKLNWSVTQRAVLLAGNVGALRVWWQGDNDGYLGELGQRANAIVFEPGKAPRFEKSAALSLPAGIPQ